MPVEIRNTRQKEAIRSAFAQADRPLNPEEVWAIAHERVDGLSIATVYRNIGSLLKDGWLVGVDLPGDTRRYEVAGKGHHHHFQCTVCSRVYELSGCGVTIRHKLPAGFSMSGHDFTMYGSCSDCSGKPGAKAASLKRSIDLASSR